MEIDLNCITPSEMAEQHRACEMKRPFSSMVDLTTQTSNSGSRNVSDHSVKHESLTIFFSGEVHVFHGISPQKAEVVMQMAAKSKSLNINEMLEIAYKEIKGNKSIAHSAPNIQLNLNSKPAKEYSAPNACNNYARGHGALAMARRATLARFLEKRKHRLISARPYKYGTNTAKLTNHPEEETASSSFHWEH